MSSKPTTVLNDAQRQDLFSLLKCDVLDNAALNDFLQSVPAEAHTEAMMIAIQAGNTQGMEAVMSSGVDINQIVDQGKWTLLSLAVNIGKTDAIELMLAHGADPNLVPTNSWTGPVALAIMQRNYALIEVLMAHGASPLTKIKFAAGATVSEHGADARRSPTVLPGQCTLMEFARQVGDARSIGLLETAWLEQGTRSPAHGGRMHSRL